MDKASVSGAEDRGSIPLGGTNALLFSLLFSLLLLLLSGSSIHVLAKEGRGSSFDPSRLEETTPKYSEYDLSNSVAGFKAEKPLFKIYPKAERVLLPKQAKKEQSGVFSTMAARRSRRSFAEGKIGLTEVSKILYAAAGISGERWSMPLRTAPSAGALYPIEIYLVVHSARELDSGVYHLAVEAFALERLRSGNWKKACAFASMNQCGKRREAATLILTFMKERVRQKYHSRGDRYGWIEMGAILQNILLAIEDLNLSAVPIGAFHDKRVRKILGITDSHEVPGMMIPLGNRLGNGR